MTDTGITGVHHVGLHVRDLGRSIAFYRDVLGLELLGRRDSRGGFVAEIVGYPDAVMRVAWLRHPDGGPIVEIIQYVVPAEAPIDPAPPHPGTTHLAFAVADIHAVVGRLLQAGATFRSPAPVAIAEGVNRGGYAIYFADPDGITLELLQAPR